MSRIPYPGGSVAGNLVETTEVLVAPFDKPSIVLPPRFPRTAGDLKTVIHTAVAALSGRFEVPPAEALFFAGKMWQIATSCEERRLVDYERINWWDFIEAVSHSLAYQQYLGNANTRSLVAAKSRRASTKTVGDMFLQMVLDAVTPGISTDRVLNGPTNDVWIGPWLKYLRERGVAYHLDAEVRAIHVERGVVRGATVALGDRTLRIEGDYFIAALPVERMAQLLTPELLAADPSFGNLNDLTEYVEWMNGIQFYLKEDVRLAHGHVIYVDSPWALTSVSQPQFWRGFDLSQCGDGGARGLLSVDISDWDVRGLNGKEAQHCTRDEIALEVWEQLKRSLNGAGQAILRDDQLHSWFLDPDIAPVDPSRPGSETNAEPLLVNYVDTWRLRPEATTRIPNFFLASDYVRTYTDLATMEAANEAARRAVNGILRAAGSRRDAVPALDAQRAGSPPAPACLRPDSISKGVAVGRRRHLHRRVCDGPREPGGRIAGGRRAPARDERERARHGGRALARRPAGRRGGSGGRGSRERRGCARLERRRSSSTENRGPTMNALPDLLPGRGEFETQLAAYRAMVAPLIAGAVPDREPRRHLYDLIASHLSRGGKGFRPALCIATCRAFGGRSEEALPSAAALELLHNALLVHDDIEDSSDYRRDKPTLHRQHGIPIAVNVGDAMNAMSVRMLRQNVPLLGPELSARIVDEFDHMTMETIEGQAMELRMGSRQRLRDHRRRLPAHGAEEDLLVQLHPAVPHRRLDFPERPARPRGLRSIRLFSRRGFSDPRRRTQPRGRPRQEYGKEIGGDLLEGKRTLILAHLFQSCEGHERERLAAFFAKPRGQRLPREVAWVYEMLRRYGSIDHAKRASRAFVEEARREFESAYGGATPGADTDFLRGLLDYVVARDL